MTRNILLVDLNVFSRDLSEEELYLTQIFIMEEHVRGYEVYGINLEKDFSLQGVPPSLHSIIKDQLYVEAEAGKLELTQMIEYTKQDVEEVILFTNDKSLAGLVDEGKVCTPHYLINKARGI